VPNQTFGAVIDKSIEVAFVTKTGTPVYVSGSEVSVSVRLEGSSGETEHRQQHPTEQRVRAIRKRALQRPDGESGLFLHGACMHVELFVRSLDD
jgi:hypothetical protein